MNLREFVEQGTSRRARLLGHGILPDQNGFKVKLRIRLDGLDAFVEYTDAASVTDGWTKLAASYSVFCPMADIALPGVTHLVLTMEAQEAMSGDRQLEKCLNCGSTRSGHQDGRCFVRGKVTELRWSFNSDPVVS